MTAPTTAPAQTDTRTTWKIDPAHTMVEFSTKHMMLTTVRGRFADVEGVIYTDAQNPSNSSVDATLKTASIDTRAEQRDQHLRSADFFDVENWPTITFKSTRIEGDKEHFKLTGDLSIRGTTKSITLDVQFEGMNRDPWGGERAGFTASGKLDRREFGLLWNQALEAGGILVSNDVKISIEAQAIRSA